MSEFKKPADPTNSHSSLVRPWAGSVSLALGLWLISSGTSGTDTGITLPGAILILVGCFLLIFKIFPSSDNKLDVIPKFILPLTLGVGAGIALIFLEHSFRYIMFPFPLDDGEGFVLNQAILLKNKFPLYPLISEPPYIVTNYPPVFPLLLSLFTNPLNPSFFAGRFLTLLASVVLAVSAGGCVKSATGDRRAGIITFLLVFASPIIFFWGALVRVDILASALSLAGLWVAMRSRNGIFYSIPLLVAALFTRQSSIETAFAIGAVLILRPVVYGNRPAFLTRTLPFIAGWIIAVVAVFGILQAWTGGQFWLHTVTYTRTEYFFGRMLNNFALIIKHHALLFLVALITLPTAIRDRKKFILAAFFIASFGTALLAGKVGSDLNYFINLAVASSILAGSFIADLFKKLEASESRSGVLIPAMLLIPAIMIHSGMMEGHRAWSFTPTSEDIESGNRIVEVLSSVNGPILCEDEGFCLKAGHEVLFNPFIMSEMAREGYWDESDFITAIQNKEFDLIMLRFDVFAEYHDDTPGYGNNAGWDRFTPAMEAAISENYSYDSSMLREITTDEGRFIQVVPFYMRRYWFIYRPEGTSPVYEEQSIDLENLLAD